MSIDTKKKQIVKGTHSLSSTEDGISQDTKRKKEENRLSLSIKGRDKLGHQEKVRKQRILTSCQTQREGQVRTLRESKHMRGTYQLWSIEEGTSQNTKRKQESNGWEHRTEN